jgi:hypothetical protein
MSDEDFSVLKTDIEKNGLITPIVTYEGQILDGRNRYKACKQLNIEPETIEYDGCDPLSYVISLNEARRHLTISQRAMLAANVANMKSGSRTDLEPPANLQEVSISDAAKKHKVSERMVSAANKLAKAAPPAVVEAVRDGILTVNAAQKLIERTKVDDLVNLSRAQLLELSKTIIEPIEKHIKKITRLVTQLHQEYDVLFQYERTDEVKSAFGDVHLQLGSIIHYIDSYAYNGLSPLNPQIAKQSGYSECTTIILTQIKKDIKLKLGITKTGILPPELNLQIYYYLNANWRDYAAFRNLRYSKKHNYQQEEEL